MPISRRANGIANDGRFAGSPAEIDFAQMRTPTLIISAEDDRFGTAQTARTIQERTPSAQIRVFPTGGHIWLGHDKELSDEITNFVRCHDCVLAN